MASVESIWEFANAIKQAFSGNGGTDRLATVERVDADGTAWVVLAGNAKPTPVSTLGASVEPGDRVTVNLRGSKLAVLTNSSDPATGAKATGRAIRSAVDPVKRETEIARGIADEAKAVADATGQHFWDDDNGAHVTDVTQDEWNDAVADNFSDYDPDTKPYHNQLLNSLGILLRTALNNLVSITRSAIAFYDGTGNAASNIVARFGSDGAQIGKSSAAHVEISQKALAVSTGGFATDKRFVAGLANDPVTGLATIELFGVLDSIQIKSGVEYYAIENGGIEPTSFTAIEIDGVSHSVTGLSYSDTAILLDKAEYASYSRSVAKITYATEDPVPTMFYGTTYNVSGVNTGSNSAAFGYTSSALGLASFAAGYNADAWGACSAAIGRNSDAYGRDSAAFGYGAKTEAKGIGSVALGHNAKTSAMFAISAGNGVVAQNLEETVLGAYNDYANDVNPYGRTQYNNRGKYALVIGNGTADNARSNALAVDWDGAIECATDTAWITLNGTIKYRIHHGVCYVCGDSVSGGTSVGTSGTNVGTLPVEARPSVTVTGAASTKSNAANGQFSIDSSGVITVWNLSTSSPYWCFTAAFPVG